MTTAASYRRTSDVQIFGLPLYEFASGSDPRTGKCFSEAQAILAIGDSARGIIAIGGRARGLIAIGGAAFGVISIGGFSVGVLSIGGTAIGLVAVGGLAVGAIAVGGLAIGLNVALGGMGIQILGAGTHRGVHL